MNRIDRESRTVLTMIRMHCRAAHHPSGAGRAALCAECASLNDYAQLRLRTCRFGIRKPTCDTCPVHCYQKDKRERIRVVMRFAGPRMIFGHPVMAVRHLLERGRVFNP